MKHDYVFQSFIRLESIPFQLPPKFDWIFFSSPNAVIHFFKSNPSYPSHVKHAVLGEGTKQTLTQMGLTPQFIGEGNIDQIGEQFSAKVSTQTVLFPLPTISKKSIQKHLSPNQVLNLVVYQTHHQNIPLEKIDAAFFTSPSNAGAFELNNIFPKTVVTIGDTTALWFLNKHIPVLNANNYDYKVWIPLLESAIS